jgi:ABC-type Na+ efflux pump permease subunit
VETFAGFVVGASTWLVFTQLLGIVAVMAGHAVLHDRQVGTLPFLLLAPVRRIELLTGKVLGVLLPPLVPYALVSGSAAAYASTLSVAQPHLALLPPSPAWMLAFLVGGPIMFFATFGCGYLLAGLMPDGAGVQAVVAGMGAVATLGALFAGSQVISRDLSR